jgi:catechol 2,3-dioxygenase-like lactoylglutathione lyase family enzyme
MSIAASKDKGIMPVIRGLHHFAYKCRNAEETRRFYEDVLQMPLAHVMVRRDLRTTTGELVSFLHLFFEMGDGSFLAFFDLGDGTAPALDPNTPQFSTHLAVRVDGEHALLAAKARLDEHRVPTLGPIDQDGLCRSIYFTDPNGVRLELTYELSAISKEHLTEGREILERWTAEHALAQTA